MYKSLSLEEQFITETIIILTYLACEFSKLRFIYVQAKKYKTKEVN